MIEFTSLLVELGVSGWCYVRKSVVRDAYMMSRCAVWFRREGGRIVRFGLLRCLGVVRLKGVQYIHWLRRKSVL